MEAGRFKRLMKGVLRGSYIPGTDDNLIFPDINTIVYISSGTALVRNLSSFFIDDSFAEDNLTFTQKETMMRYLDDLK